MTAPKPTSFLERLKEKATQQENYGGTSHTAAAKMDAADCPACGAGRARQDGLTNCAYCGHSFIAQPLTDGIYIKKEDNSH